MHSSDAMKNLERVTKTPLLDSLGAMFESAGYELALVGGPVRDAILGRVAPDIDLTTNATPEQILENAPKRTREVKVEANVVAYFGDLFIAWKQALTAIAKSKN